MKILSVIARNKVTKPASADPSSGGQSQMRRFLGIAASVCGLLAMTTWPLHAAEDAALVSQGRTAFELHCVRCHGTEGKGDGPDSKRIPVVPRNLTEGTFKFSSSVQGTPPSDADLLWTLNHGLTGSGMPSFNNLNLPVKKALVAYVKTLSTAFETKPEPLSPPNIRAKVDLTKGKEIFGKLQCALCHGESGRANGTSAATLNDSWGRPIKPANLTQGWTYRAGDSATQIYYRLMAGINGAPMPSYAEAVTPDDAWQLSKYVESLQQKPQWKASLPVQTITGDLPHDFADAGWSSVPKSEINLQGSFYQAGRKEFTTVHSVAVQAAANDQALAFRLFWDDPTGDKTTKSDAFLLALCPKNYKGKGTQNLHNQYFPGAEALDLYYWNAQNPNVVRQVVSTLDSATRPGARFTNELKASSTYEDGAWTLTFSRPKQLGGADTLTEADRSLRMGCIAWDASNDETGLKRSASQWISLVLKTEQAHH